MTPVSKQSSEGSGMENSANEAQNKNQSQEMLTYDLRKPEQDAPIPSPEQLNDMLKKAFDKPASKNTFHSQPLRIVAKSGKIPYQNFERLVAENHAQEKQRIRHIQRSNAGRVGTGRDSNEGNNSAKRVGAVMAADNGQSQQKRANIPRTGTPEEVELQAPVPVATNQNNQMVRRQPLDRNLRTLYSVRELISAQPHTFRAHLLEKHRVASYKQEEMGGAAVHQQRAIVQALPQSGFFALPLNVQIQLNNEMNFHAMNWIQSFDRFEENCVKLLDMLDKRSANSEQNRAPMTVAEALNIPSQSLPQVVVSSTSTSTSTHGILRPTPVYELSDHLLTDIKQAMINKMNQEPNQNVMNPTVGPFVPVSLPPPVQSETNFGEPNTNSAYEETGAETAQ